VASGIGEGFSRGLMRAEGRGERIQRIDVQLLQRSRVTAPSLLFLFLSLYHFFLSFEATSATNELGIDGFMLYSLLKTITMEDALTNTFHFESC